MIFRMSISNGQSLPCRFQVCVGCAGVVVVWLNVELLLWVGWWTCCGGREMSSTFHGHEVVGQILNLPSL